MLDADRAFLVEFEFWIFGRLQRIEALIYATSKLDAHLWSPMPRKCTCARVLDAIGGKAEGDEEKPQEN